MSNFLHGAAMLASATVALFFLRYWRSTGDRLFVMFSVAFSLLSAHWVVLSVSPGLVNHAHVLRFAAFALIALAVLDKNRQRSSDRA